MMIFLFSLCARIITEPPVVRYSSAIQLKNMYSKNRLTVTTENSGPQYEIPIIFSSRPPFDDGWSWIVEPDNDDMNLARTPVKCGQNISLINPISKYYVSTRNGLAGIEIVPSSHIQGSQSTWTVICESGENWVRDIPIQLRNAKLDCYLSTSLSQRTKELVNRFNVTCSPLSQDAVWKAVEGVYFIDKEASSEESEKTDDL